MLKKLNFTLLGIAIFLGVVCLGFTLYYNKVDVAQSNIVQTLEGTLNPSGGQ